MTPTGPLVPPPHSLPASPACPFCDTRETHLLSPFGGQLSVAQYWCRRCRTGFDYLKWGAGADEGVGEGR